MPTLTPPSFSNAPPPLHPAQWQSIHDTIVVDSHLHTHTYIQCLNFEHSYKNNPGKPGSSFAAHHVFERDGNNMLSYDAGKTTHIHDSSRGISFYIEHRHNLKHVC